MNALLRQVPVRVVHTATVNGQHQALMIGQVKFYAGRITGTCKRPAVAHTPLCRCATARVGVNLKLARLGRQDQTSLLLHPVADFLKQLVQKSFVQMRRVG